MELRQLTEYEHFEWVNMRAITFLFVDQSSSRQLAKGARKLRVEKKETSRAKTEDLPYYRTGGLVNEQS